MDNSFFRSLYSKKSIKEMQDKINLMGLTDKYNPIIILNLRIFTSLIIFFMVLYIIDFGYIFAPIITFLYFIFFKKLFLDTKIRQREIELEQESIHFFEVLTLSLETGRNLESALTITTSNIDSEISSVFKEALRGIKYGKSLTECLQNMQKYIPSEAINNIIISLTHANIYGNSIIDTLNTQIDYIREKRVLETKAEISKVPIKISVISVLFFVPLILLIILAPVLLTYIN